MLPKDVYERVEAKISPEPNTGCWIWTGALLNGYGRFLAPGRKSKLAHRLVYEQVKGPIPEGMFLCHRCDTTWCVNPDHMFVGTARDNSQDMARKGRSSKGPTLTPAQAEEIRKSNAQGVSGYELAEKYDVDATVVFGILRGLTYRNGLPELPNDDSTVLPVEGRLRLDRRFRAHRGARKADPAG